MVFVTNDISSSFHLSSQILNKIKKKKEMKLTCNNIGEAFFFLLALSVNYFRNKKMIFSHAPRDLECWGI